MVDSQVVEKRAEPWLRYFAFNLLVCKYCFYVPSQKCEYFEGTNCPCWRAMGKDGSILSRDEKLSGPRFQYDPGRSSTVLRPSGKLVFNRNCHLFSIVSLNFLNWSEGALLENSKTNNSTSRMPRWWFWVEKWKATDVFMFGFWMSL